MKQLNLFIELIRLKKPIGFMLLFWPCAWGLTISYDFTMNHNYYYFYLSLFLLGSILMRSAGCIVNDIFDKKKSMNINYLIYYFLTRISHISLVSLYLSLK